MVGGGNKILKELIAKRTKVSSLVIIFLSGLILLILIHPVNYNMDCKRNGWDEQPLPKIYATAPPILIDDFVPSQQWEDCPWVNGTGTIGDPFVIRNLIIDGGGVQSCIQIRNTQRNFRIENCSLTGARGDFADAGISILASSNGIIQNNTCVDNLVYGILLYYCTNFSLLQNTCSRNSIYGTGITLENSHNVVIINNSCMQNEDNGIYLSYSNNNTITTNVLGQNYFSIYLQTSSDNVISNNHGYDDGAIKIASSSYNIIRDNSLENEACYIGGSSNNLLLGNNFSCIEITGSSDSNVVRNTKCGDYIRVFQSNNNIIENINYTGSISYSIILDSAKNNTFVQNRMGLSGIYLTGSSEEVINNSIDATNVVNGKPVLFFANQSSGTVEGEAGQVLLASCTNFTVSMQSASSVIIKLIYSSNNTISGNNCSSRGISLVYSSNNTIYGNNCTGTNAGIVISTSQNNTVRGNNCSGSTTGISLYACNNSILSDNYCSKNYGYGIRTMLRCNYNKFIRNTCTGNSYYGIQLIDSHYNDLIANNCTGNAVNGIQVNSSNGNMLENNNCTGNSNFGIMLEGSTGSTIEDNYCSDNNGTGISPRNSNNNLIVGNECLRNNRYGILLNHSNNNDVFENYAINNKLGQILEDTCTGNNISNNILVFVVSFYTSSPPFIAGHDISFISDEIGGVAPISYQWYFGDESANSTLPNPTHQYGTTGTYTVVLTVFDKDGDTATFSQDVYVVEDTTPAAYFSQSNFTIIAGQTISFTDGTIGGNAPLTYQWNFGDESNNSTLPNPTHQYTTAGEFTVLLTVRDVDGDISIASQDIQVLQDFQPVAAFSPSNYTIIAGQWIFFSNASTGGNPTLTYQWDFGDGSENSTLLNPSHQYHSFGTFTVTLTVMDADLDTSTVSHEVLVCEDLFPVASFQANSTLIVTGQWIWFREVTTSGNAPLSYQWNFGDGSANSTLPAPSHQYTVAGRYMVTLTVIDSNGDIASYQSYITVENPQVLPDWSWLGPVLMASVIGCVATGIVVKIRKRKNRQSPVLQRAPTQDTLFKPHPLNMNLEELEKALRLKPYDANLWYFVGQARAQNHNPVGALSAYKEAIHIERCFPDAWMAIGGILQNLGDSNGAEHAYKMAAVSKGDASSSKRGFVI